MLTFGCECIANAEIQKSTKRVAIATWLQQLPYTYFNRIPLTVHFLSFFFFSPISHCYSDYIRLWPLEHTFKMEQHEIKIKMKWSSKLNKNKLILFIEPQSISMYPIHARKWCYNLLKCISFFFKFSFDNHTNLYLCHIWNIDDMYQSRNVAIRNGIYIYIERL